MRTRMVVLTLALLAAILAGTGAEGNREAQAASGNNFYLAVPGSSDPCGTLSGVASCYIQNGSTFTLEVRLSKLSLPDTDADTVAGYIAWQASVNYGAGLTRVDASGVSESLCPSGWFGGEAGSPPSYVGGCVSIPDAESTATGPIMRLAFTCSAPGANSVTLLHGPVDTVLGDDSGSIVSNDPSGASETLTVNCVAAPSDCLHVVWTWDGNDCVVGTDLWHIETLADLGSGDLLAFNQGCTGSPAVGCNYNTGAAISGTATSPTFSATDGASLVFSTARGTESACGSYDRTLVSYSTNSGASYSPLDFTGATITSGGQYLSTGGEICGGSLTLQTVDAPLPDGTTNVRFTFDSVDNLNNLFVGQFIDDVYVAYPDNAITFGVRDFKAGGVSVWDTCWSFSYYDAALSRYVMLDVVSDNNGISSCDAFGGPLIDGHPAFGDLDVELSTGTRLSYGNGWRAHGPVVANGYFLETNAVVCNPLPDPLMCDGGDIAMQVDGAADLDGDGCASGKEQQTAVGSEATGGRRNYRNRWDFFDPNGDKTVDLLNDVFAVAGVFGADADSDPPGEPDGYNPLLDRSPPDPGMDPWDMQAPDGTIDLLTDIFGVAKQFGHNCS